MSWLLWIFRIFFDPEICKRSKIQIFDIKEAKLNYSLDDSILSALSAPSFDPSSSLLLSA